MTSARRMHYFDHNATAPMLPEARSAWLQAAEEFVGNPSSEHRLGQRAARALEQAREQLAEQLTCDPQEIVWTSGATESVNLVMHHLAQTREPGTRLLISSVEHPCLHAAAQLHHADYLEMLAVDEQGRVRLDELKIRLKANADRPAAVAVMAANNETGVLQPWQELLSLCADHGVPFVCDATQWLGRLPMRGLGNCDYVAGSSHKCGGPRGIGFLKVPHGCRFRTFMVGGPQEERRRAGTENVAGAIAMVTALGARERVMDTTTAHLHESRRDAFEAFLAKAVPGVSVVGRGVPRLWNTSLLLMPPLGDDRARWVVKLDKAGFAVSTGSACASGREVPSHVLSAMGVPESEARRSIRISSGWETMEMEWTALREAMIRIWQEA